MPLELSVKKSVDLANALELVKFYLVQIDWEYAEAAAKAILEKASSQESMAVLNPSHRQSKNDLLRVQGTALLKIVEAVKLLKECDELKRRIGDEEEIFEDVKRMFL